MGDEIMCKQAVGQPEQMANGFPSFQMQEPTHLKAT